MGMIEGRDKNCPSRHQIPDPSVPLVEEAGKEFDIGSERARAVDLSGTRLRLAMTLVGQNSVLRALNEPVFWRLSGLTISRKPRVLLAAPLSRRGVRTKYGLI
jgi:hypothetical protein